MQYRGVQYHINLGWAGDQHQDLLDETVDIVQRLPLQGIIPVCSSGG